MKNKKRFISLLLMGVFLVVASSCDKDDDNGIENLPILSTTEVTEITENTAISGGIITDDGGTTVSVRGVCWSTNETPTINDYITEDGKGAGSFTSSVADLEPNTTYYLRAYATNSAGTGYGSAMSFTTKYDFGSGEITYSSFTDSRDGNTYKTFKIGEQIWMAENLKYLPSVTGISTDLQTAPHYYVYGYDGTVVNDAKATSNYDTYGVLYNWSAAMDGVASSNANPSGVQGVCPTGWHLPSDAEWKELEISLGMSQSDVDNTGWRGTNEGSKLAGNADLWSVGDLKRDVDFGTSGFAALPSGYRYYDGVDGIGSSCDWWVATETSTTHAYSRSLSSSKNTIRRVGSNDGGKKRGFSVRCVMD